MRTVARCLAHRGGVSVAAAAGCGVRPPVAVAAPVTPQWALRWCTTTPAFDPAAFRATRIPELVAQHGDGHPAVASAYARLAEHAWESQTDVAEALRIQEADVIPRLEAAVASGTGEEDQLRDACMTQAQRLLAAGRQDAALALIDAKVLPLTTKKHGAAHQETLSVAYLAAQNQASAGKFDAARDTIENKILAQKQVMQATGKLKAADKSVQLLFLLAAELLAEIDLSTDNERRALELLGTGVIPGYRFLFGKGPNEHILRASKMLAVAHCTLGNPAEGLRLFEGSVLSQEVALLGAESADVADTRFKMGQCLMYLERPKDAVEQLKSAADACTAVKGANDPATTAIQTTLVSALFAAGDATAAEALYNGTVRPALTAAGDATALAQADVQLAADLSKHDPARAFAMLSGDVAAAVKPLGDTSPVAIECHLRRAELLAGALGRPDQALEVLGASVLPQQVAVYGKKSAQVFDSVLLCARGMFLCGENASAVQLLETEGASLAKAVFGDAPSLASAQCALLRAMALDASGKAGAAVVAVTTEVIPTVTAQRAALAPGKVVPPRLAAVEQGLESIAQGNGGVSDGLRDIVKGALAAPASGGDAAKP